MRSFALSLAGAAAIAFLAAAPAQAEDKFTYMTNWYAQAEHGGFYRRWRRASTRSTAWT